MKENEKKDCYEGLKESRIGLIWGFLSSLPSYSIGLVGSEVEGADHSLSLNSPIFTYFDKLMI